MICDNISIKNGTLYFAGQSTAELAAEYGTPLYLMDEDKIRENCNIYKNAFKKYMGDEDLPLYASKANSFKYIYKIMSEENMGIDVVSPGEIFTAAAAGYDLSKAFFHGNNKTNKDIIFAIDNGIGYFVVDNQEEIEAIEAEASKRNISQKILLRITPGIDTHTYEAINTGKVDSKFGSAIETGQAKSITAFTLKQPHIHLSGFHCHVGSQVFAEDVFERAAVIMLNFISSIKNGLSYEAEMLDLGGGYGVRYIESDPSIDIEQKISSVANVINTTCRELNIKRPTILMEPGRSIVADAGMTLYSAGTVKKIPGYKNYVSVDGSMADHIRYALYGSRYTCYCANKMNEESNFDCSLVGRCCESGDIIQDNIQLPASIERNDIIAVCTTGAYHYSMASNYNRLPKLPIIMLKQGKHFIAVKRESLEDLIRNEI